MSISDKLLIDIYLTIRNDRSSMDEPKKPEQDAPTTDTSSSPQSSDTSTLGVKPPAQDLSSDTPPVQDPASPTATVDTSSEPSTSTPETTPTPESTPAPVTPTPDPTATEPITAITPDQSTPTSAPDLLVTDPNSAVQTPAQPDDSTDVHASSQHKKFPMIIGALLFFVSLAGLAGYLFLKPSPVPNATVTDVQDTGSAPAVERTIIMGTDTPYPPMEYVDEKGQFAGYDIELAQKIGEEMGAKIKFKEIEWDKLVSVTAPEQTALARGDIDMAMSSITITDERKKFFDFSESYLNAGQVLVTLKTNTTISTKEDLMGKKVGVIAGQTSVPEAKKLTQPANVLEIADTPPLVEALKTGTVSAIIQDLTGAKGLINENPDMKIASDPFTVEPYGIMVKKGNNKLLNDINAALERLREKGILDELRQKWLK